jgi:diadenosine tetraphosphate (Ap4A) HIT family hydrolase
MKDAYKKYLIKNWLSWRLYLHTDQRYLGRAYAWLAREGELQDFSELTTQELLELRQVCRTYRAALAALWSPGLMNYAWLGNFLHEHGGHGHLHIVPRYAQPVEFIGRSFSDNNWGKNYAPYIKFPLPDEELFVIRDTVRNALQKVSFV